MSKIELYHSADATNDDVTSLLQQYKLKVNWSTTDDAIALDIGCGDGKVTAEAIKALIPQTVRLEACDSSKEVLEFAEKKYGDRDITYILWDATSNIPEGSQEKYDHVVSFYCFEYIKDQRTALKNIYNILKPGGNCFIVQMPKLPFYECIKKLSKEPKWTDYLVNVHEKCKVTLEEVEDPKRTFEEFMSDAGFKNLVVNKEKICNSFKSWDRVEDLATYADPYLDTLPFAMQREYMGDYLAELQELSGYLQEQCDKSRDVTGLICTKEVLVAYGEKAA